MLKGFPEITYKSNIPIRNYGLGKTIKLDNLVKIEFRNFENIYGLSIRNKMGHLRETIDNHKNRIMFLCSMWKPKHKIHTYILPKASRNRQRGVKTSILFSMLNWLASSTLTNQFSDISFQTRLEKLTFHLLDGFIPFKMS